MALLELILAEIERTGPLPFSRYMDLALYHPVHGFYATGGAGRRRDFITSPEVGPLFGAVIGLSIDRWWDDLGRPDRFTFVDVGAGPGSLARSVMSEELRCAGALEYVAVEVSAAQRDRHPDGVVSVEHTPVDLDAGVIFANELLDNLPFDILDYRTEHGWTEVRVGGSSSGLFEVLVEVDYAPAVAIDPAVDVRMPRADAAADWLTGSLSSLRRGRVVVVDYAVDTYPVTDRRDWLRTFSEHGRAGSAFEAPGTKDITADIEIAALARVQIPDVADSQARWLESHGIHALVRAGRRHPVDASTGPDLAAMKMKSRIPEAEALLDPAGLGGFTVLEWIVSPE